MKPATFDLEACEQAASEIKALCGHIWLFNVESYERHFPRGYHALAKGAQTVLGYDHEHGGVPSAARLKIVRQCVLELHKLLLAERKDLPEPDIAIDHCNNALKYLRASRGGK